MRTGKVGTTPLFFVNRATSRLGDVSIMKSEFALAFNQICAEYGLPREVVLEAVSAALVTAYRRDWKVPTTQNVTADISLETGLARIYVEFAVVETAAEVEDPQTQIALADAQRKKPGIQVGELIMVDVTPHNFGRIAAQTAKQVITQRLREAERESQFNRVSRQEKEIIIGTVQSVTPQGITLHLERTEEAHMPRREQIPGEHYMIHQKIRVYVVEVRRASRGPEIVVSRSHPLMLRRLLELEVPEVRAGQVELVTVAREAGTRSKVAVLGKQAGLDPVGACVGVKGVRIQNISRELHGERIDVLEWSKDPATFIRNSLGVTQILCVTLDENNPGGRTASVVVMDDQLSLAIGRSGQNARLAAKLTNWRIDMQGATEAAVWALDQVNKTPDLVDDLGSASGLVPKLATVIRTHEKERYPYTDEEKRIIGSAVQAVREAQIARREIERPEATQARARRTEQEKADAERQQARKDAFARVPKEAYEMDLDSLGLSTKVRSHLLTAGLANVGQVMERIALGDEGLLALTGIGAKSLREIKDAVEQTGLQFTGLTEEATLAAEALGREPEEAVFEATEAELVTDELEVEPVTETADEVVLAAESVTELAAEPSVIAESAGEAELEAGTEGEATPEPALEEGATAVLPGAVEYEDTDEELSPEGAADKEKGRKKRRKKGRAMVYDDSTGETFVVRSRRRKDTWDEFGY